MKPIPIFLIVFLATVLNTYADDTFYLVSKKSGQKFGPYEFKTGSEVKLGNAVLVIQRVETVNTKVADKLDKIVIPQVDFRQASIRDVIDYFKRRSMHDDPDGRGVNVTLIIPKGREIYSSESDFSFLTQSVDPAERKKLKKNRLIIPHITFTGRRITLKQAMDVVAEKAHMTYTIENGIIIFRPKE